MITFSIAISLFGGRFRQVIARRRWLEARGFHMIQRAAPAALDLELGSGGDAGQQLPALAAAKLDEHGRVLC